MSGSNENRLVWSSESGHIGGAKRKKPAGKRRRSAAASGFPDDGVTRVRREKGGRGGKTVTVLYGVPGGQAAQVSLLKELKGFCGCGGTAKEGRIEIQGDQREKVLSILADKGIAAKAAGG